MEADELDALIDDFERALQDDGRLQFFERDWSRIWGLTKEIGDGFRDAWYPTGRDKHDALQRFKGLRERARELSQEQRDAREQRSDYLRELILAVVEAARPQDMFGAAPVGREDLVAYGGTLKEAADLLSNHKHEMLGEDKSACFDAIKEMREVHDAWWTKFHEERDEAIRERIARNTEKLSRATDALERHRSRAQELREKISSAWNDDWQSRAEGWLSETEEKIGDIESQIAKIEAWIEEDEARLS